MVEVYQRPPDFDPRDADGEEYIVSANSPFDEPAFLNTAVKFFTDEINLGIPEA